MYVYIKRTFDVLFALVLVVLLLPLLLVIAFILLNTAEKVVLYKQTRIGQFGKKYHVIKFSSMLKNSSKMGLGFHTTRKDPRVTKFGKTLRLSKLNELPQLFNILDGSMSFVGPRPMIEKSFLKYDKKARKKIFSNTPGLTGLGSIVFRDEERMVSDYEKIGGKTTDLYLDYIFPSKQILELWYNKNKSFSVDIKILFLTGIAVFFKGQKLHFILFRSVPWERLTLLKKDVK
jgi:lipopolysaccharide/colanic/teichoic acid biosynthesis glycosyltransferase